MPKEEREKERVRERGQEQSVRSAPQLEIGVRCEVIGRYLSLDFLSRSFLLFDISLIIHRYFRYIPQ